MSGSSSFINFDQPRELTIAGDDASAPSPAAEEEHRARTKVTPTKAPALPTAAIARSVWSGVWGGGPMESLGEQPSHQSRVELAVRVEFLKGVPLFEGMPAAELRDMAAALEHVSFADGQEIVTQGEPGDAMFLLQHGAPVVEVEGKEVMTFEVCAAASQQLSSWRRSARI